jgi:hypothetical protein
MARPRRTDLPEGIGRDPDRVVALREGVTREAIIHLRNANGIPPADPMWRAKWMEARGKVKEWDGSF